MTSPESSFGGSSLASLAATEFFRNLDLRSLEGTAKEIEWVSLDPGQLLMRQGEAGDALYVVVSGRLGAFVSRSGGVEEQVGEIRRGETVGEMAVIADERRSATVKALRHSLLAKLSRSSFDKLRTRHPEVAMSIAQILGRRLRDSNQGSGRIEKSASIALLPATPGVPLREFGERITAALSQHASTFHQTLEGFHLTQEPAALCGDASRDDAAFSGWVSEQEQAHRFVVFEADPANPEWTRRCLGNSDRVLILARAGESEAAARESIRAAGLDACLATKDLVLLHSDAPISGTAQWLAAFGPVNHHHLRLDAQPDYEKIARIVSGRAVGLALGGGGARGFAHIGVVKALREASIPIDFVGGTSMGSIMAAEVALGWSPEEMLDRSEKGFRVNPFKGDYTLPTVGVTTARKIVRVLSDLFGDARIEDQWTGYFGIAVNLTRGEMVVGRDGLFRQCTRASSSLPAYWPPVILAGELLVDGAVMNNVPGDVMKKVCEGPVIAVDVSPRRELRSSLADTESMSGWAALGKDRPPGLVAVVLRSIMLHSVLAAEEMSKQADLYLHPPVQSVDMFDLPAIRRAADIGYHYTVEQLESGAWNPETKARPATHG